MGKPESTPSRRALLLQTAPVRRHAMLPSSNYTYRVELSDGELSCVAIYKPRDGESPLWDFPANTLYQREYLAYRVSEALGWGIVPFTVIRDGPFGVGSMQLFIQAQAGRHYFNLMPTFKSQLARMALFDCIVNNCDRKGGHCLLDQEEHIWGIDHGLTFASGPKLRTVMWDLAEEPVEPEARRQVHELCHNQALLDELSGLLSKQEVAAFHARIEVILASATIPIQQLADPYRPLPWPAI